MTNINEELLNIFPIPCIYYEIMQNAQGNDDCNLLYANNAFETMTAEAISKNEKKKNVLTLEHIIHVNLKRIFGFNGRCVSKKPLTRYESIFQKWCKITTYPVKQNRYITVFVDMTEEQKDPIERMFPYMLPNDILFELDEGYRFTNVACLNEAYLSILKNDFIGKTIYDMPMQSLAVQYKQAMIKAKNEGRKQTIPYCSTCDNDNRYFKADILYNNFIDKERYFIHVSDTTGSQDTNQQSVLSKNLFQEVFEQAPVGIAVGIYGQNIIHINDKFRELTGRSLDELNSCGLVGCLHPSDLSRNQPKLKAMREHRIDNYADLYRIVRPDKQCLWIHSLLTNFEMSPDNNGQNHYICFISDVSETIQANRSLFESERSKSVFLANMPGMAYRCKADESWTMEFVSDGCYELTGYKPETFIDNREQSFNDIIGDEYRLQVAEDWQKALFNKSKYKGEYEIKTASGELKWVLEKGQATYGEDGSVIAIEGLIIDIQESKEHESTVNYMNRHDDLTGLYNRKYFITEMKRLDDRRYYPLSIIVGDINGVRLVNKAFGETEGDRLIIDVASIMKHHCRSTDFLARIGGDDFCILMPNTEKDQAITIMRRIQNDCRQHFFSHVNDYRFSNISMGSATKVSSDEDLESLYRLAEDYMFRRKLLDRKSSHANIITSIMATLYAKSQETEQHTIRIADLCSKIGNELQLATNQLDMLVLFSMLHDIGKIGIDNNILSKPGELNDEEWKIIKTHPEIGYNIAISSPELEEIADFIFTHHERWDGKGYPRGLAATQIPLLSRILAVADAYDALTNDRVYRKAISTQEAIKEICENSGTQFDPEVVDAFIKITSKQMRI